ncbi:MAG: type IV secretion system protein [Sphingomonadales bacterium]|jgi:type IV secretion system protein VirB6
MISACPIPGTGSNFLAGTLLFIDCATQDLAGEGYRSLSGAGASGGIVLGVLLTLFVANQGLRLLGGQSPTGRELLLLTLKLGAVLTLAGSWDAYRVLVYDVVLRAPAEIIGDIAQGAGLGGGNLISRLQQVDQGMLTLTKLGSGYLDIGSAQGTQPPDGDIARTPLADGYALAGARIVYLVAVIAVFGALRLMSGLLLALGPLFAGLLLFDATRGLFLAWARLLFGSLLGAVVVTAILEVELALVLPWLSDVLTQRIARIATPSAPVELLVLVAAFGLVSFTGLRLIWSLSLAPALASFKAEFSAADLRQMVPSVPAIAPVPILSRGGGMVGSDGMSSNPVVVIDRADGLPSSGSRVPDVTRTAEARGESAPGITPLGQSYTRRIRAISAGRRQGPRVR